MSDNNQKKNALNDFLGAVGDASNNEEDWIVDVEIEKDTEG